MYMGRPRENGVSHRGCRIERHHAALRERAQEHNRAMRAAQAEREGELRLEVVRAEERCERQRQQEVPRLYIFCVCIYSAVTHTLISCHTRYAGHGDCVTVYTHSCFVRYAMYRTMRQRAPLVHGQG